MRTTRALSFCAFFCQLILLAIGGNPRNEPRRSLPPKLSKIHVNPETGRFEDEFGRVRIFHGVNSVIKHFPWFDEKLLDVKRLRQLQDELGFNVIRLGAMWSGVEPEEGRINQTYVDKLKELADSFEAHGLYTILDMHQDLLWKGGQNDDAPHTYWGVPSWVKHKQKAPKQYYPWPLKGFPDAWFCGYFSQEISHGFEELYRNRKGIRTSLANFWKLLAKELGQKRGLLGYELINEPWAGDIMQDLSLLLPGVAGRKNLAPLYEELSAAIREIDNETLVFWEPVTWGYMLPYNASPLLDTLAEDLLSSLSLPDITRFIRPVCGEFVDDLDRLAADKGWRSPNDVASEPDSSRDMTSTFLSLVLQLAGQAGSANRKYQAAQLLTTGLESASEVTGLALGNILTKLTSMDHDKPSVFGPGLTQVPGGDDYLNRTVMSWHYYCWVDEAEDPGNNGESYDPLLRAICDGVQAPTMFKTVQQRAAELGTPPGRSDTPPGRSDTPSGRGTTPPRRSATMLTEFGLCTPDISQPDTRDTIECNFVMDRMDAQMESWIYWDAATGGVIWDGEGRLIPDIAAAFARPFPSAVSGRPVSYAFSADTKIFSMEFYPMEYEENQPPTEIFLSPFYFPDPDTYQVETSTDLKWEVAKDRKNYLYVYNSPISTITNISTVKVFSRK